MVRSEQEVERLVQDHQGLVGFMVQRYLQRCFVGDMEREDLISWGMIGLLQAARAWDPARSRSFATLACRAIERMIIRGVSRPCIGFPSRYSIVCSVIVSPSRVCSDRRVNSEMRISRSQ